MKKSLTPGIEFKYKFKIQKEKTVPALYPESEELCDFCDNRRSMQNKHISRIKDIFENRMKKNIIQIPLFRNEIRKYSKLKEMSEFLIK